jgi:phosphoglycolate phosphatase-like HAD superfamily hydrolase
VHAVIFDVDGTLLQSASVDDTLYRASVTAILGSVRFRPNLTDYDFVTDSGILSQILADNSIRPNQDQTSEIKARFVEALTSHIREHGPFREILGAKKMLDNLADSDAHLVAIATGGWLDTALLKLQSANIDLTHLPIATSDDSFERTEIMTLALSKLGSTFSSITYYGDGPWDRDACMVLGWKFVAVGAALGGIDSYLGLSDA